MFAKIQHNIVLPPKDNMTRSKNWKPPNNFRVKKHEIDYILAVVYAIIWTKCKFHDFFKRLEENLLNDFRDEINRCGIANKQLSNVWMREAYTDWRYLALFRDFHDHMCGRDRKHYIRTDDCRRFIAGVQKGVASNEFIKPVHRMLTGKYAPGGFTHPLFKKFNK